MRSAQRMTRSAVDMMLAPYGFMSRSAGRARAIPFLFQPLITPLKRITQVTAAPTLPFIAAAGGCAPYKRRARAARGIYNIRDANACSSVASRSASTGVASLCSSLSYYNEHASYWRSAHKYHAFMPTMLIGGTASLSPPDRSPAAVAFQPARSSAAQAYAHRQQLVRVYAHMAILAHCRRSCCAVNIPLDRHLAAFAVTNADVVALLFLLPRRSLRA